MTTTVTPDEAASQFRDLLARVERGDVVVIERDGEIVARLVPDARLEPGDDEQGIAAEFDGSAKWPPGFVELENGVVITPGGHRLGTARLKYGPLDPDWDEPMTEEELAEFIDSPVFPSDSAS